MTDDEIQSMLEHGNKSGKPGAGVSFDDFYRLMQKKVRFHTPTGDAPQRAPPPFGSSLTLVSSPPPRSQHNAGAIDDLLGDDE